jgi:hypothetical protein
VTSRRSAWTWSSYFPHGLLEPRKRGEQALLSVVQQAYVCGVSTRRVDQLVESLGLRISRSEVSRVCALLDEQVEAFRCRPLEGDYPYPTNVSVNSYTTSRDLTRGRAASASGRPTPMRASRSTARSSPPPNGRAC